MIEVTAINKSLDADITLPASKSISNRVLIIKAIGNLNFNIQNLSGSNDTRQLNEILQQNETIVDVGEGGTTLRFLMAYYCLAGKEVTLTASGSLMHRPLGVLIDALLSLGASIDYLEEDGRLPVRINKSKIINKSVSLPGDISSQFISALMMIGPYIHGGLQIEITGEILSLPYIKMTQSVMEYFGARVEMKDNIVFIEEGEYSSRDIEIEPDWSAASYWYEIAALSDDAEILLRGLKPGSLQGDAVIYEMMKQLGVETTFTDEGAKLKKTNNNSVVNYFTYDFSGCPDLGPAVAATCAGLNITADLSGLKNFRLKESDRAVAMQRGLYNLNVSTDFCGGSKFKIYAGNGIKFSNRTINTYTDHRIAMAFAPLALKTGKVIIDDESVVGKSYPGYWEDLKKAGCSCY
jgi:3-phosphoshikimate 1-carboxyvinyltransferase